MIDADRAAYARGEIVHNVCVWDNGAIVLPPGMWLLEDAVVAAIRDHQATIAHQAARRARGIVDVEPAPFVDRRPQMAAR